MLTRLSCLAALFALLLTSAASAEEPSKEDLEFFEKKIRPLLADNCFECHGPDKQKATLRLDSREAIVKGGESGPAIEPGEPDKSLLIDAVNYVGDTQMPPKGKLEDEQIASLKEWIKRGAPWSKEKPTEAAPKKSEFNLAQRKAKQWALQPIVRAEPPAVKNAAWAKSDIDRFLLAKLEAAGLSPAPASDKRTLLRRVTFDLIGLPPTPAETTAFLADETPQAFETVVDRLLQSPHYGERWGRHWLDLMRFAETRGHEFDFEIPQAYEYRDYVVRALNVDLPFDQFVIEHIAGDLLPEPRRDKQSGINESIIATGSFYLGEGKHSPVDILGDEADRVDNQIDVFGKAFLGCTIACARCHDHKFDAISQQDYYALAGYLQSSRMQTACIDAPEPNRQIAASLFKLRDEQEALLKPIAPAAPAAAKSADAPIKEGRPEWLVWDDFSSEGYANWFVTGDAFGAGPLRTPFVALGPGWEKPLRNVLSPGMAHSGALSSRFEGALRSKTFAITHPRIWYHACGTGGRIRLIVDSLQFTQNPIYGGLQFTLEGGGPLAWREMHVDKWVGHNAYIEVLDEGDGQVALDRVLFSVGGPPPDPPGYDPPLVAKAPPEMQAQLSKLHQKQQELAGGIRYQRKALVIADGTGEDEFLFLRGNPRKHGDPVSRRLLEAIAGADQPKPAQGSGRLELARRLVAPSNPLPARVIANRLWQHHFGEGLVRTPDDFGNMGQPPTHPELLDFLADGLVRDGWSLKRLHKRILLTAAYQMSSEPADPVAEERDPQNTLWHRRSLQRLEAEIIRDAMLSVSGRLDPTLSGPSVLPNLTPFMIGRGRPGSTGPLDGNGRRSLYINVRRNFLNPLFLAFDYPVPFSAIGRRTVSNVPSQALALMNNPLVLQQAEVWSNRVLKSASDPDARIRLMYESAFTRPPADDELASAREFVTAQSLQYGTPDDPRAWRDLAHVLFNAKEFIFVN